MFLVSPVPAQDPPAIILKSLDGQEHQPLKAGAKKGVVFFFVSPYCPTSNTFVPEMNRIAADYGKEFTFYFVHADQDLKSADILQHTELNGIKSIVLLDEGQKLARLEKAKFTPEAVVTGPDGRTLYQGRINNLYLGPTKRQRQATTKDLRDALDAIQTGKPVSPAEPHDAVGCKISGLDSK
ncbi:MAG: hypothetical protein V4726_04305 [Verrucomicrobiota bacterium]